MGLSDRVDARGVVQIADSSDQETRTHRLGTVTAVTAGSPNTVTVEGRPMRYLASYSPTVGDTVVWVRQGSTAVCLGELA